MNDASVNMLLDDMDSGEGAFELKTRMYIGYFALSYKAQVTFVLFAHVGQEWAIYQFCIFVIHKVPRVSQIN